MARVIAALAALALAFASPVVAQQDALGNANEAFSRGDFKGAAQLFAAAADSERDPARRAEVRVRLAVTYFNLGNRQKAEDALAAALADRPQLELVEDFYADEFLSLFKRARARRSAAQAAQARPGQASPQPAATSLVALRQRFALAVDEVALDVLLIDVRALEIVTPTPELADVLDFKSEVLERLGNGEGSLEERGRAAAIRAVTQAMPGSTPMPLDALLDARRLLAGSRAAEAAALSRGILQALPSCAPALEVLAEALLGAGRLDEAHSALRTALSEREKPELLLLLGEVELRRGDLASARDAFRRVADADAGHDRANAALGMLAARLGDLETAQQALDRALQANGTLVEARVLRAQLALGRGDAQAALADLQRALQMRPDDPWVAGWLGVAHLAGGNAAAAAGALARAIDVPLDTFVVARAEAARRLGDLDAALEALGARRGESAALLRTRILLDSGRAGAALGLAQSLAAEYPASGAARYLLACAHHRQRDWRRAHEELSGAAGLAGAPAATAEAIAHTAATLAAQGLLDAAASPPPPPVR